MMCFAFLVNLTAYPLSHGLLPYVARDVYAIDANGLAQLMASFSLGALAGSLWLAWSGRTANALRFVVAGIYGWYVLLLVFAQFDSKTAGLLLLAMIGLAQSLSMVSMSAMWRTRTWFLRLVAWSVAK